MQLNVCDVWNKANDAHKKFCIQSFNKRRCNCTILYTVNEALILFLHFLHVLHNATNRNTFSPYSMSCVFCTTSFDGHSWFVPFLTKSETIFDIQQRKSIIKKSTQKARVTSLLVTHRHYWNIKNWKWKKKKVFILNVFTSYCLFTPEGDTSCSQSPNARTVSQ